MMTLNTTRRIPLLLAATAAVALAACGDDKDTFEPTGDESWRFADPDDGNPDEPVGDNGEFTFTPEPGGTAPGYYVVATVGGEELRSGEIEVRLDEHPTLTGEDDAPFGGAHQALSIPGPNADTVADPSAGAGGLAQAVAALPDAPTRVPASAMPAPPEQAPVTIRFEHPATPLYRPPRAPEELLHALTASRGPAPFAVQKSNHGLDTDRDGVPNDEDNCPLVSNRAQDDEDEDGIGDSCQDDWDGDGIVDEGGDGPCNGGREDCNDNCPEVRNPRQIDTDGDGVGDLCDEDRDGNGTPDIEESTDWDGDGIPTSEEGTGDTDGDGIPDAFDADDDGDNIPTRDERGVDTDGDGIPDDRDTDSDGDGVPDRYEGHRDTDGDGTPDSRDTDDDGDGSPTSVELGPAHRDPNANLVPRWLDPTEDENTEPCATVNPRDIVPTLNTFAGWSPWFVMGYSFGFGGAGYSFGWATHFAPEGVYASLQLGAGATFPPELAEAGINFGMGMIRPPEAPILSAATVEGVSLGFSMSAFLYTVGFTIFEAANLRPHRAIQLDLGVSIGSSGLFGLPFGISLMRSAMTLRTETGDPGFVFVHAWGDGCAPATNKANGQSFDDFTADLAGATSGTGSGMLGALRAQTAATALPMFEMLSESGAAPAEGIPASTNGAWAGEFMGRSTTSLCRECSDMSIDGVIRDAHYRAMLAGEEGGSLLNATMGSTFQALRAWPDRSRQAVANDLARGAVDATFAHAYENTARVNGLPNRYVADEVTTIRGQVGVPIAFSITAEEIADLVGATVADVEGATVCMRSDYSGPRAGDVCGQLTAAGVNGEMTIEEVTSILYMVEVDLLTANSDFGGAPVEEWTVRPPAILLTTEPGEADRAVLSGPESIWSGAPTTLAASVIDEAGMIVDGPVTFAFYGPGGELLETIESERGSATYQTQPVSVEPTLTAARLSMITFESGLEVEGLVLEGTGLSGYATVKVRGQDIAERGYELAWVDSRTLVATPTGDEPEPLEGGTVTIEVVSPGGASTGTASFDL